MRNLMRRFSWKSSTDTAVSLLMKRGKQAQQQIFKLLLQLRHRKSRKDEDKQLLS